MNTVLDADPEAFRKAAHDAVDWIASYYQNIRSYPVLSASAPGEIKASLAGSPPGAPRSFADLMQEFESKILPGITHWNHPAFFAYFSITGSQAGLIGEMLSAALNLNGMLWKTSPAVTELEETTLDWLREILGLPAGLFGIINDTASINTFLALAAARDALGLDIRTKGMSGRDLPQLRVYCSDQAHSSVDKAVVALGMGTDGLIRVESDERFRMRPAALEAAIRADLQSGVRPCAVVATLGTTSTASVDPLREVGVIARKAGMWLHVDAAYAGSAGIAPEFRSVWDGIEAADSIVTNPHKWLFTQVDCSVLFTRRPDVLKETFSIIPEYLKTAATGVVDYMDYGLQLGRRFRALKLWLVLQHYGVDHLAEVVRGHVAYAARLASALQAREDVELLAPQSFSVVVFRKVVRDASGAVDDAASEQASAALMEQINASGKAFVSHTKLRGTYGIRVAIGNGATTWEDVEQLLTYL